MNIHEIFYSIQGEGQWTGIPNIFIRTTGCNLRCSYCDTTYAYASGKQMSIDEILHQIKRYPCTYVCITGGEPLLQEETVDLIARLIHNKYQVSVETNGSITIKNICRMKPLLISLDIKCPSSKMHEQMHMENLSYLSKNDQVKFIISDRVDYEYAKQVLQKYPVPCQVFFQPVWGTDPGRLAGWILNDQLSVRLGLQIHKILWGEEEGR